MFIVPLDLSDDYLDTDISKDDIKAIIKNISDSFIGYCYLNKINTYMPYVEYINALSTFLEGDTTNLSIFENTIITSDDEQKGGAKKPAVILNYDEATNLLNDIKELNETNEVKEELTVLSNIYTGKSNDMYNGDVNLKIKDYNAKRIELLNKYRDILNKYEQTKKAGDLYGFLDAVPLINMRSTKNTLNVNFEDNFFKKIDTLLLEYYSIISKYNDEKEKIERQREKDLLAQQQSSLTSNDKDVRQFFCTFIARAGLFLTNSCDINGNVIINNKQKSSALITEINILLYIAEWNKINSDKNNGWGTVTSQRLDDILIDYFIDTYNSQNITNDNSYVFGREKYKYVVNNAANISNSLKKYSFCPYSSILDGMLQCSWETSQGLIEYGNMNFYITNEKNAETMYYNGRQTIISSNSSANSSANSSENSSGYPTDLQLSYEVKLPALTIDGSKAIKISGNDLEAHNVLKNTLLNVINYILGAEQTDRDIIFSTNNNENVFNNLFIHFSKNVTLFNTVYSEILFKGTGDLFQEINCVSKYGGYTMENYEADQGILSYAESGDQRRFFAANDRPSGTRFIYMLLMGDPNEINVKSMGGYYAGNIDKLLIVKRPATKGGKRITYNSKKNIKSKKNRKTKKNKKNIHGKLNGNKSKKYKKSKKHTFTRKQ